jgi:hypothetical protein
VRSQLNARTLGHNRVIRPLPAAEYAVIKSIVTFPNRAFCFTGKFFDLKRSAAEREVRSRGGLIQDRINERLDYLVIGDEASPAWKHGGYGRKIEQAQVFHRAGHSLPILVSESMFLEALVNCPCNDSGDVDEKIVVCNYKFILDRPNEQFDQDKIAEILSALASRFQCHVSARAGWASMHQALFANDATEVRSQDALVIEYRFVRHQSLDSPTSDFVNAVSKAFEAIDGIDGTLRWFERVEGSASFVRLLNEIPQSLRVTLS